MQTHLDGCKFDSGLNTKYACHLLVGVLLNALSTDYWDFSFLPVDSVVLGYMQELVDNNHRFCTPSKC